MSKAEFIKKARENYNVTARYSGNTNTMYLSGNKAKEAKKELFGTGFAVGVGYAERTERVKADAIAD